MKTSNKLLIALAALLIIIPIFVVAVNVKLNYQDQNSSQKDYVDGYNSFDKKSPEAKSLETSTFSAINIANANDAYLNIKIIKDEKSGIKISTDIADNFGFAVDKNGTLQITMKNGDQKLPYSPTIFIYGNNISKISIAKAGALYVDINADSLIIEAKDMSHLSFESTARLKVLTINADHVQDIIPGSNSINKIESNINESEFRTGEVNYNWLAINAKGESKIEITGDEKLPEKYRIDNLKINTSDHTALSIENIIINNISGNLADETKVQMPVKYLKQMLKN
ncbi:DUF2807 domain-containing protein [uncultured Pedobacter sp.]|uniref:GIN domain-containing protein n=1 Tax=uncultured Pedobacter sp. TaxID=246139 RepID=UPI0025F98076|nr:DUF2807 domain-containing protein [uncultured Pedobacter sp.]